MHAARGEANFWNNACPLPLLVVFLRVPPLRRSVDKSCAWTMENGRIESTETMRVCLLLQRYTWVKLVVRLELPRGLVARSRDPAAYFMGAAGNGASAWEIRRGWNRESPRYVIFMPLGAALYGCIACLLQHLLSNYNGRGCRMVKIIYILINMIFSTCTYSLYFCTFKFKRWNIFLFQFGELLLLRPATTCTSVRANRFSLAERIIAMVRRLFNFGVYVR